MPVTNCPHCNCDFQWNWEDAFLKFGYDDPREYLPKKLIRLLDRELPANGEVAA
jgi:hypothetical protein